MLGRVGEQFRRSDYVEIRDTLNKNKRLGVGIGAGVLVLAVVLIAYQLRGSGSSGLSAIDNAYYTDDNGKTFFKADAYQVSPFDRDGKQAYRAEVFKCADGKEFVGLVYRHNATGKKAMEEHLAKGKDDEMGTFLSGLERMGTDVKPPAAPDSAWVPNLDPDAARRSVPCPGGGGPAMVVMP